MYHKQDMATFSAGTSNIELVEKNKKEFPAAFQSKSRLSYYSSLFNSVEVNSTFYRLPLPATLEKWTKEVPDEFRFTLKLWREITHEKNFIFTSEQVEKFMRIADRIGDKKGALLIQFPAGTGAVHIGRLEKLLEEIKRSDSGHSKDPGHSWKIAVEFRQPSWYNEQVYSLLTQYGAALVWHDKPVMDKEEWYSRGSFIYLRFHGPNGDYKGSYSEAFLQKTALQIGAWLRQGKDVFTYFNNTMEGDAPKNLIALQKKVQDVFNQKKESA
jgi:uncharacterized protein YecE (DUF72 family)